jgi:rhodanese-related sulfurtransferase
MKPCGTCQSFPQSDKKIYKAEQKLDSQILQHIPSAPFVAFGPSLTPFSSPLVFKANGLRPKTWVYYFGAEPRDPTKPLLTKNRAYASFSNSGLVRTDSSGRASFELACPQVYIYDDKKVYERHFHFVYARPDGTWEDQLYTQPLVCEVEEEFIKKNHSKITIIDALSSNSYNKQHIAGALSLPYDEKWGASRIKKILGTKPQQSPIVVYCLQPTCGAAIGVIQRLQKLGYQNLFYYKKGLKNWTGAKQSLVPTP